MRDLIGWGDLIRIVFLPVAVFRSTISKFLVWKAMSLEEG